MVLKQSTNNLINGDVIPGRYGPLQSARRRFCFFAKFQNLTTNFFAAVLSILPLCQSSVSLVSTQITEPCCESTKATDTFISSRSSWFRFRTSIPEHSLANVNLRHFVIWTCTSKISHDKKAEENNKNLFIDIGINDFENIHWRRHMYEHEYFELNNM